MTKVYIVQNTDDCNFIVAASLDKDKLIEYMKDYDVDENDPNPEEDNHLLFIEDFGSFCSVADKDVDEYDRFYPYELVEEDLI